MNDALFLHRIHFALRSRFTTYFRRLTMGLAPLIVILKTLAIKTGNDAYNKAARFWTKIFGINFAFGVVTGIPMEFEFGTNWSRFSQLTGGVIGQPLAMEGTFSFFLESAFLGLFLFGERRLGKWGHWCAALLVFLGSWLSGFFIIVTDAPASCGIHPSAEWNVQRNQLLGAPHESLGLDSIRAQHVRRARHGSIRNGRSGSILSSRSQA